MKQSGRQASEVVVGDLRDENLIVFLIACTAFFIHAFAQFCSSCELRLQGPAGAVGTVATVPANLLGQETKILSLHYY